MREAKKTTVDGDWAKVNKDIKDGDRIKILDSGRIVEGDYGPRSVFRILTTSKREFNLAFNQTSKNNLIDAWGPETEEWAGKIAKVFVVRQMIGDGLKSVIYLAPEGWTMNDEGKFINPDRVEPENSDPDNIPF